MRYVFFSSFFFLPQLFLSLFLVLTRRIGDLSALETLFVCDCIHPPFTFHLLLFCFETLSHLNPQCRELKASYLMLHNRSVKICCMSREHFYCFKVSLFSFLVLSFLVLSFLVRPMRASSFSSLLPPSFHSVFPSLRLIFKPLFSIAFLQISRASSHSLWPSLHSAMSSASNMSLCSSLLMSFVSLSMIMAPRAGLRSKPL